MMTPDTVFPPQGQRKSASALNALFFRTPNARYVFVPNTGHIHRIESAGTSVDSIETDKQSIGEQLDCRAAESVMSGYGTEEISEAVNHQLAHMTLGVTRECNLRCSYCVYSGKFADLRSHANEHMSEETALQACDYFLQHLSADKREVFFTYYGGEPFLNFPVIVTTHAYLTGILKERVQFSITTNGTLLDKPVRDFLVRNRIHLTVSLDGDRTTHDRYRRFPNGSPSFDQVIGNVEKLRAENESYFNLYVTFAVTVNAESDYRILEQFFSRYRNTIKISGVMSYGSAGIAPVRGNTKNMPYLIDRFIEGCLAHAFDNPTERQRYKFSSDVIAKGLKMIHNRAIAEDGSSFPLTLRLDKHCVPGATKIFVATDGTFYPCEKLDAYGHLAIGNLESGVSPQKVSDDLQAYAELRNTCCRECYLVNICTLCFQSATSGSRWDADKMAIYCDCAREEFAKAFSIYAEILEQDGSALDFLDRQRYRES